MEAADSDADAERDDDETKMEAADSDAEISTKTQDTAAGTETSISSVQRYACDITIDKLISCVEMQRTEGTKVAKDEARPFAVRFGELRCIHKKYWQQRARIVQKMKKVDVVHSRVDLHVEADFVWSKNYVNIKMTSQKELKRKESSAKIKMRVRQDSIRPWWVAERIIKSLIEHDQMFVSSENAEYFETKLLVVSFVLYV